MRVINNWGGEYRWGNESLGIWVGEMNDLGVGNRVKRELIED